MAAPPESVFAALADGRSYPEWWRPVYLDVDADGDPGMGNVSRQHFKGRLPTTCAPSRGSSRSTRRAR